MIIQTTCWLPLASIALDAVSEEKSKDLPSQVFPPRLLVVHDAAAGGQHHKPKLTGGKQVVGPLLDVSDANIEPMVTNIDQAV